MLFCNHNNVRYIVNKKHFTGLPFTESTILHHYFSTRRKMKTERKNLESKFFQFLCADVRRNKWREESVILNVSTTIPKAKICEFTNHNVIKYASTAMLSRLANTTILTHISELSICAHKCSNWINHPFFISAFLISWLSPNHEQPTPLKYVPHCAIHDLLRMANQPSISNFTCGRMPHNNDTLHYTHTRLQRYAKHKLRPRICLCAPSHVNNDFYFAPQRDMINVHTPTSQAMQEITRARRVLYQTKHCKKH